MLAPKLSPPWTLIIESLIDAPTNPPAIVDETVLLLDVDKVVAGASVLADVEVETEAKAEAADG